MPIRWSRTVLLISLLAFALFDSGCRMVADPEPPPMDAETQGISEELEAALTSIETAYGVTIRVDADDTDFFPSAWERRPIFGRAEALDPADLERNLPAIERFLERYPVEVLMRDLESLRLSGRLVFYGRSYGGTNSSDAVFATIRSVDEGYTEDYVEGLLHAEFSSVLLRRHADLFDDQGFDVSIPDGFSYSGTGVEVLHKKGLFDTDHELLERGFLSAYATSSRENDINAFARWQMTRPRALDALAQRFPRIAAKREAVGSFLASLGVTVHSAPE